jgi:acetyl esterase/lipase
MRYRRATLILCVLFTAVSGRPALAQQENLPAYVRTAIIEMGPNLNPEVVVGTIGLMRPLQAPRTGMPVHKDVAYGAEPFQSLDLYIPQGNAAQPVPIVVFVHGGGFRIGDKRGGENIAAYFARHGMLGVTINYRLAPEVTWPTQSLDLGNAIGWLRDNAARFGGDPRTIVVIGHSSGAAVVASYLLDHSIDTARDGVVGAVLISGVYGYETRAPDYYGHDATEAANRMPRSHAAGTGPPLQIVTSEFDPPRIAADSHQFAAALCLARGKCPTFVSLSSHNHMSEIESIDTGDDRLGSDIREFIGALGKSK